MGNVRLNPVVDLGLSDPGGNSWDASSQPTAPGFVNSPSTDVSQFDGSFDYPGQVKLVREDFQEDPRAGDIPQDSKNNSLVFIFALILFLVSLGGFIFFLLRFWGVI